MTNPFWLNPVYTVKTEPRPESIGIEVQLDERSIDLSVGGRGGPHSVAFLDVHAIVELRAKLGRALRDLGVRAE